jgi:hypothetical protein
MPYRGTVRITVSAEAAGFVARRGGRLWVWAAHSRMCCAGSPAWMHASTEPPPGLTGFLPMTAAGIDVFFRPAGDHQPATLDIALHGRRRPQVEAYWDGCLMAML